MFYYKVNLIERKITLDAGTTKNNEPRVIFLRGELYKAISEQKTIRDNLYEKCSYVFFRDGKKVKKDFRKQWEKALNECGFRLKYKWYAYRS